MKSVVLLLGSFAGGRGQQGLDGSNSGLFNVADFLERAVYIELTENLRPLGSAIERSVLNWCIH